MNRTLTDLLARQRHTLSAGLAGLLVAFAGAPASMAQDGAGDYEWEPGEGYHEEEWYDPSDWFDGEDGVDYEYDYYYGRDYGNDWDDARDDTNWWINDDYNYYDDYYSAYYDGYYDGYYDDEYGYDYDIWEDDEYAEGFADGYYDGYYDRVADYDYDPYYYIYTTTVTAGDRASDRQRRSDEMRKRGDRMEQMADSDAKHRTRQANNTRERVAEEHRKSSKVRGTVADIQFLKGSGAENRKPLIARVEMEDGKKAVVNFGPKMERSMVPFGVGDRVTLSGRVKQSDERRTLTVHTINSNAGVYKIASRSDSDRMRGDQRQGDRTASIEGRVRDIRRVNIGGSDYTVFNMIMRDRPNCLVAMPADEIRSVDDLDIEPGDDIRVRGRTTQMNDRRVIVADRVVVNGERKQISSR